MQTLVNGTQVIRPTSLGPTVATLNAVPQASTSSDKAIALKAAYRAMFKENRDLDFHHNSQLDSRYLNGQITTRELIRDMLCSDMYTNFILATNSNFRFVALCFERVLGRSATQDEVYKWSSLLASEGLNSFAEKLTSTDEYLGAFGDNVVPHRRSEKLFSSDQNMPALPKELSIKRYTGPGNENQFSSYFFGGGGTKQWTTPPEISKKVGAVLTVAGLIEVARIVATVAFEAFSTGGM